VLSEFCHIKSLLFQFYINFCVHLTFHSQTHHGKHLRMFALQLLNLMMCHMTFSLVMLAGREGYKFSPTRENIP